MHIQSPFIGRMSRRNFIWGQVILVITILLIFSIVLRGQFSIDILIDKNSQIMTILLFMAPLSLAFQFICSFRRLHDMGYSGLWAFLLFSSLLFIPLVDILFLIYISYKKGDEEENQFGHPDNRPLFASLLNKNSTKV